jgi:hypothetical protein
MRRLIVVASAIAALAIPSLAFADADGYGNAGSIRAGEVGAQCGTGAASGAFGAFGTYGYLHDFGHVYPGDSNGAPGANGYQTGLNNSAVCGNRTL